MSRTIFEVAPGGNIQTAVNSAHALATRAVVHVQEGAYSQNVTLPVNTDVQLVGDGWMKTEIYGTVLIEGPSKATLREIGVDGNGVVEAIKMRNIDQVGARVRMFGTSLHTGVNNTLFVNGLDHCVVEISDSYYVYGGAIGMKVVGGPLAAAGTPANGKVIIYSGLAAHVTDAIHDFSNGAQVIIRDMWYEEGVESNVGMRIEDTLVNVTLEASKIYQISGDFASIQNMTGTVSLLCNLASGDTLMGGAGAGKVLAAGNLMMENYLSRNGGVPHDYFVNSGSATARLHNSREWDPTPTTQDSNPTPNEGTTSDALLLEMFAQTRAIRCPALLEDLPAGVTDIRFFRVGAKNGTNSMHLSGQERTGFRLHFG